MKKRKRKWRRSKIVKEKNEKEIQKMVTIEKLARKESEKEIKKSRTK